MKIVKIIAYTIITIATYNNFAMYQNKKQNFFIFPVQQPAKTPQNTIENHIQQQSSANLKAQFDLACAKAGNSYCMNNQPNVAPQLATAIAQHNFNITCKK